MKRITIFLVAIFLGGGVSAQSLNVSSVSSAIQTNKAAIDQSGLTVTENGEEILSANYSYPSEPDPSLKAYPLNDGSVVVRENIANFLLYDTFGRVNNSISNSTRSEGGESISEFASDPAGKTIIVYNPKVIANGSTGSRAKKIDYRNVPLDIYYSADRELKDVQISANGEFIAFISSKGGTDDEVQLTDRFGNDLKTITFDQEIKGVTFSENGLFVTIYSSGRAAAYEIRSGNRVGSTSFRTNIKFAAYSPTDKTIVAITGEGDSSISGLEFHAVNVDARKIAREEINGSVTMLQSPVFIREGKGSYRIKGFSKDFILKAAF